jgi:acyl carrier protein
LRIQSLLAPLFPEIGRSLQAEDSPVTLWPWDSLRQVNIILAVEEAFDITLTTAEIMQLGSVGALAEVLRGRGLDIEV